MPERFTTKEVIEVWYPHLETLIIKTYLEHKASPPYGDKYSIPAALESSNDTYHLFENCDGGEEWDEKNESGENLLDLWIEHDEAPTSYGYPYYPKPASFINKLIRDGHLEPGNYLVEVMW